MTKKFYAAEVARSRLLVFGTDKEPDDSDLLNPMLARLKEATSDENAIQYFPSIEAIAVFPESDENSSESIVIDKEKKLWGIAGEARSSELYVGKKNFIELPAEDDSSAELYVRIQYPSGSLSNEKDY